MRSILSKIMFFIFVALHLTSVAHARTSLDLSKVTTGAKSKAMGGTAVTLRNAGNVFTNPAGISSINKWAFTSMSTQVFQQIDYKMFGAAYTTEWGVFGVGYAGAVTPAGFKTTGKGQLSGASISYGSNLFTVSYASKLPFLANTSAGISAKYFSNKFDGVAGSGSGFNADLGVQYAPDQNITIGANLINFVPQSMGGGLNWDTGTKEKLPMLLKTGASAQVLDNLTLAGDVDLANSQPAVFHGGVEWKLDPIFSLRGGVDNNEVSFGAGIDAGGFCFDYAYKTNSQIENNASQYFSVSYSAF